MDVAVAGHNNPPEPTPVERAEDLIIVCNRWMAERPNILDDEMAAKGRDFVDQLRKSSTAVEAAKKKEKAPYQECIADIDQIYRAPSSKIALALDAMRLKMTAWADELDRRKLAEKTRQQEEARQAQHEAEQAALAAEIAVEKGNAIDAQYAADEAARRADEARRAADKPVEKVQIRGEFAGRAMAMRTTWHAEIIDEQAALKTYGKHPVVRAAALEAALKVAGDVVRQLKADMPCPPGFRFYSTRKAT